MRKGNQNSSEAESSMDLPAAIGGRAPSFIAKTADGSRMDQVSLSDYKGNWLILFFYPADFTSV